MPLSWRRAAAAGLIAGMLAGPAPAQTSTDGEAEAARHAMVGVIARIIAATAEETAVTAIDARILAAFDKVPRHLFVPTPLVAYAYADTPLPLGHGQNLAQPFIAALMTQLLDPRPGEKIFETGTDTGFHAAILAELGAEVYSVEIVKPLLDVARRVLGELGHTRIMLRQADGYSGWAQHAPYDAILVKESSVEIPPALLRQLKPGGRMVIPLGPPAGPQYLTLVRKNGDGTIAQRRVLSVRFTPFQGGERT